MLSDLISQDLFLVSASPPHQHPAVTGGRGGAMSKVHKEEDAEVPQEGAAGDVIPQKTPPVNLPVETERTRVPNPSGDASPAAHGDPRNLSRPGSSMEEARRRGRKGWAAPDQGGIAVSGEVESEECGRERLKRHRVAMAGRVWIPDTWGQEGLLKDWVDCAAVDRTLVPSGLVSAREALVEEYRRVDPGARFRIESRCLST